MCNDAAITSATSFQRTVNDCMSVDVYSRSLADLQKSFVSGRAAIRAWNKKCCVSADIMRIRDKLCVCLPASSQKSPRAPMMGEFLRRSCSTALYLGNSPVVATLLDSTGEPGCLNLVPILQRVSINFLSLCWQWSYSCWWYHCYIDGITQFSAIQILIQFRFVWGYASSLEYETLIDV